MLSPGDRLGGYVVAGTLGAGGMGVVYRARDTRLERDVALKTLDPRGLTPAEESSRIVREARRAAALNHPNVCTIHEVQDGPDGAFIVMELVDGRTLASMVASGPLPPESVVAYGSQMAGALAHAHERGLLHRDIKSANVLVTPSGQVKVLDFGLAAPTPAAARDVSTRTEIDGGPAGTLAYMAPEVLRGQPADERSDVWSLGVVLYEMCAGTRPFHGETAMTLGSAILNDALPPLSPRVPASLRAVIARCLRREPSARYQGAAEVAASLAVTGSGPAPRSTRVSRVVVVVVLAAAAGAAAWWTIATKSRPGPPRLSAQRAVALFGGSFRQASLSPDASLVAYVDAGAAVPHIWVKPLATGDPIQVTRGDTPAANPAWAPDNSRIVFERRRQGLWAVSPLGGEPQRLLDFGERPRFSADGASLVFERNRRQIWMCRPDGSKARRVDGVPEPWYPTGMSPALSPDGQSIVYFATELGPNGDFWIVPASGGEPRRLTSDLTEASDPIWTPDGRYIVFSSLRGGSRTLWRVAAAGGTPEPVTVGAGDDIEPAISRDGRTLVYTNVHNRWRLMTAEADSGQARVLIERRTELLWPRVSPDGASIAFFGRGRFGDVQIFVAASDGQAVRQLTEGRGQINTMPRWAPDGSRLFYYQNRPSDTFRVMPVAGGAGDEVAKWNWEAYIGAEPNPASGWFVYGRAPSPRDPKAAFATVVANPATSESRTLGTALTMPRWSPDGRAVAGHTQAAPLTVTVCQADGAAPCRPLTHGRAPVWTADGSRLYFLRDTANPVMKELWSIATDGQKLMRHAATIGPVRPIDVTFDLAPGGRVVFTHMQPGTHELWQAELR